MRIRLLEQVYGYPEGTVLDAVEGVGLGEYEATLPDGVRIGVRSMQCEEVKAGDPDVVPANIRIRMERNVGPLKAGEVHRAGKVVLHGGHTDDSKQYVVRWVGDDVYVPESAATEVERETNIDPCQHEPDSEFVVMAENRVSGWPTFEVALSHARQDADSNPGSIVRILRVLAEVTKPEVEVRLHRGAPRVDAELLSGVRVIDSRGALPRGFEAEAVRGPLTGEGVTPPGDRNSAEGLGSGEWKLREAGRLVTVAPHRVGLPKASPGTHYAVTVVPEDDAAVDKGSFPGSIELARRAADTRKADRDALRNRAHERYRDVTGEVAEVDTIDGVKSAHADTLQSRAAKTQIRTGFGEYVGTVDLAGSGPAVINTSWGPEIGAWIGKDGAFRAPKDEAEIPSLQMTLWRVFNSMRREDAMAWVWAPGMDDKLQVRVRPGEPGKLVVDRVLDKRSPTITKSELDPPEPYGDLMRTYLDVAGEPSDDTEIEVPIDLGVLTEVQNAGIRSLAIEVVRLRGVAQRLSKSPEFRSWVESDVDVVLGRILAAYLEPLRGPEQVGARAMRTRLTRVILAARAAQQDHAAQDIGEVREAEALDIPPAPDIPIEAYEIPVELRGVDPSLEDSVASEFPEIPEPDPFSVEALVARSPDPTSDPLDEDVNERERQERDALAHSNAPDWEKEPYHRPYSIAHPPEWTHVIELLEPVEFYPRGAVIGVATVHVDEDEVDRPIRHFELADGTLISRSKVKLVERWTKLGGSRSSMAAAVEAVRLAPGDGEVAVVVTKGQEPIPLSQIGLAEVAETEAVAIPEPPAESLSVPEIAQVSETTAIPRTVTLRDFLERVERCGSPGALTDVLDDPDVTLWLVGTSAENRKAAMVAWRRCLAAYRKPAPAAE